jgi:hypothetical protein
MRIQSVKSKNPCESMIQTIYDIVTTHGGELKVKINLKYRSEYGVFLLNQ